MFSFWNITPREKNARKLKDKTRALKMDLSGCARAHEPS
jgi:hypothetical protein